ncbi:MAG: cation:proton antiporter [Anaerolineales bacterium]|nr:cation:proton antiporter [Anaerolineales bacterium]
MENILEFLGIHYQPNIITTIGLLIALTFLGSKLFQRFGLPQVVGFIIMGVLLGTSFLNLVPLELTEDLTFISEIALGLIGFDMGSHLRLDELRKKGRSILIILLFESLGTFLLVSTGIYFITNSLHTALIFGALSSATAPAATVDVLAEYDAKGPLTTSLIAVVGLDDAFSLVLYCLAAAFAESALTGTGIPSFVQIIEMPVIEIGGSLIVGILAGFLLNEILRRMKSLHDSMAVSIGFVFLCVGLSEALGFSLILTTMVMGFVVVNFDGENGRCIRFTIEQAGPVIYVLFFALVGARFQISLLPTMGLLGIGYVVLRSAGKYIGAWVGGSVGKAERQVKNNLGLGLLSQAGVAIGLAIASNNRFATLGPEGEALGALIITTITATTFIVQIFGPLGVKLAITKAGEVGMANVDSSGWHSEGRPDGCDG